MDDLWPVIGLTVEAAGGVRLGDPPPRVVAALVGEGVVARALLVSEGF